MCMNSIDVNVRNKIARCADTDAFIVCANDDYVIKFDFDAEWDEYPVKTARFIFNGSYTDVVFEGNVVNVPIIYKSTVMTVGVFAGQLRTTTPAIIPCQKSILCDKGVPADPTPDVYHQLTDICNAAVNTANGARDEAEGYARDAATSESNAKASEEASAENKTVTEQLTSRAETAAENAEKSAVNSSASEKTASQALADLLAMINSGDIVLATGGKLPLSSIPATATQEIYTVTSEDELTTLLAQRGDLAELIEEVNGESTITKTWQCLGDASVRENWVVWGTSYAVQSGNATTADNAVNANMINNHRLVEMTEEDFASAVKDADTYYLVY